MSDNNKPVGFSGAGSPQTVSGNNPDQQNTDRPITLTEVQQMIDTAVKQTLNHTQSLTDRQEARIRKEIQERIQGIESATKLMEQAGINVPAEAQEKIRRRIMDEALLGGPNSPQDAKPSEPQADRPDTDNDPTNQAALEIMREAGLTILDDDPEAQMLDQSSARGFLRSLDQAIEAKRQRIGQQQPQRAPTNLAGTGTKPGLMEQYRAEISKEGLPSHVRLSIRDKYRRMGLNI